jgi:phosphatidylinositol alpha-1,6-mannosyltransferase
MVGGIQRLLLRVCEHLPSAMVKVVAPAHERAAAADRERPFAVVRVRGGSIRQATLAAVNATVAREARSFRPDVVLVGHIVCSPGAALAGRMVGAPVVQWFHADEIGTRPGLAAFAYRSAAASIAVSSFTRDLIARVAGDTAKAHVINNGVDLPPAFRNGAGAAGPPTVLTVSRIEERYKGHDVLARALPLVRARVPDVRWVVVGDGGLRPSIESLVRANGIADAVAFAGSVTDEERDEWFRRSYVFAMPSRLPAARPGGEGFGIVFLEAGAHGLPVVAGGVGGALDAVRDGETGLLVDPTDHLAVAEAVVDLLSDTDKARRMGRAGRAFAEEHAWPLVAARVEDVLLSVARRRR